MKKLFIGCFLILLALHSKAQDHSLLEIFQNPPESAKPWVFWYWMHAAITREGISADLVAMKENGIGGAYLVPIKGAANPPFINPPAVQLSPEWSKLLRFAFEEADRLGIKIAMHASDGFATAGGPWITTELSMQKLVWTETFIRGGGVFNDTLSKPQTYAPKKPQDFYKDIAILAFPTIDKFRQSTLITVPKVITSNNANASFLPLGKGKDTFKSEGPCWIRYEFAKSFTCRTITIQTGGYTLQAYRLKIEVSDDGVNYRFVTKLVPPRNGWFDYEDDVTFAIPPVTARFFRFTHDKEGSEPGAEDLDNAKWKPTLKVKGIILSSAPSVNQVEGKNGQVWRVGSLTSSTMLPDSLCVPVDKIIDISDKLDTQGKLTWSVPPGSWTILRVGHTSTGRMNNTAGAGKGLECDKLNPEAVKFQYNHWVGEIKKMIGTELASNVLKCFHVDSWECGSQNWTPAFRDEFKNRRGYDLLKYLPAMAGIPIANADVCERFLYDVRKTITELVAEKFYGTLAELAHADGFTFTGEAVAPVMLSDGMLHYKYVDVPMGEFWFKSPSHDKPADILDATSGGHVYGRQIIQAEAFTTLRMDWSEHPGKLKTLQDQNYALGINRLVFHVFAENPWLNRRPGMTLDAVGLYFQRDQTWWKTAKAWMDYTSRCQTLLQYGQPVTDIAVFTGEENPRRAMTPDRFVQTMPGIFGSERLENERVRLANSGVPTQNVSLGLTVTSNTYDPDKWTDPLRGYAYDSFNADALLHLTSVENGNIETVSGSRYKLLVLPGHNPMVPDDKAISPDVAAKILQLAEAGATLLIDHKLEHSYGLKNAAENDRRVVTLMDKLWESKPKNIDKASVKVWSFGKGHVIEGPYLDDSFDKIGIDRDFIAKDSSGKQVKNVAWTHRQSSNGDVYFVSNQENKERVINLSLRIAGKIPEIWNPVTGEVQPANSWTIENDRTSLSLKLAANESFFVVFQQTTQDKKADEGRNWRDYKSVQTMEGTWQVTFDPKAGGPKNPVTFNSLQDWSINADTCIRYYSGSATYSKTFLWNEKTPLRVWIDLGKVANMGEVSVNGIPCGIAWTAPYRVEITKALKLGTNQLNISVTNTWANRLIGDHALPEKDRVSWTTAPYRLDGKPLLEAGLLGPVVVEVNK
jgi:hypothetical protein